MTGTLAIDFGTSNTAAAVLRDGLPHIIPLEDGNDTLPTAVFLDFAQRQTVYGSRAIEALMEGREGRFMRALKSVLGTSLMHEKRQFFQERLTLIEIVARFLNAVKTRAEGNEGQPFDKVLSGRPVRFHSKDAARNARAEDDLRACYLAAGFTQVNFLPEPEAAARAGRDETATQGLGLVVDIGGGTSDFTVFDRSGDDIAVRASFGIRLGGTDFDKTLSISHVMPLLGRGSLIKAELGDKTHSAPAALFNDLASWEKIPFLYGGDTLRAVARMHKLAKEPRKFARLHEVLEMHLGHDLAFAVEAAKTGVSIHRQETLIDLNLLEKGLQPVLTPTALERDIAPYAAEIAQAATDTLMAAQVDRSEIKEIVFVGGSSLLNTVSDHIQSAFPDAQYAYGKAFTAIVEGLAIATAE